MRRTADGQEIFDSTFPVIERIHHPFAEIPGITLEQFANLTDQEYLNRVNLFYQYLEIRYPFFRLADYPQLSAVGTDMVQCPFNYSVEQSMYVNLRLVTSVSGINREATVYADLQKFDNTAIMAGRDFTVTLLVKEFTGTEFIDWASVQGRVEVISFRSTDSTIQIMSLFRYRGIDDGAKAFKNIFIQILEVEEGSGVEIGPRHTVYTDPFESLYLVNLISNIQVSYQDFPSHEALENVVLTGQGAQNASQQSIFYEFFPGQRTRPVLMYSADLPDLAAIGYVNDGGMDILDSGAFDLDQGRPKIRNINGKDYKIYAARNMVIYTHPAKYEYKFSQPQQQF
jgi:hypothetical protein